jgi:hypothetical protein
MEFIVPVVVGSAKRPHGSRDEADIEEGIDKTIKVAINCTAHLLCIFRIQRLELKSLSIGMRITRYELVKVNYNMLS